MERIKEKLRRGKERLQGADGAGKATAKALLQATSLPTLPRDGDGEAADSATGTGNNDASQQPSREKPDLWSRAAERLSADDRAWLASASEAGPADNQVNVIMKLIGQRRDESRQWPGVEDTISSSIAWLHKFREIGDVVSSFDPVHLALPWAGVRFILQCTLEYQETMSLAMESVELTARIVHRCQVYELLYDGEEDLKAALIELYTVLLLLHVRTGQFLAKSTIDLTFRAVRKPGELKRLLLDVEARESEVSKEASTCQGKQVSRIDTRTKDAVYKLERLVDLQEPLLRVDKNVMRVLQSLEAREMAKVLEWISPIPYNLHHASVSESRTHETCEWVRERPQFREWLSELSSVTLWLQAPAGRGKTFITSKVIDTVRSSLESGENHEGFAFFYCKQTEDDRREALPILRSYVRQLCAPRYISTRGHENEQLNTDDENQQMHPELIKLYSESMVAGSGWTMQVCKKHLIQLLNLYPRTILVLDALDECNMLDRTLLLNFFNSLSREVSKPVKIFIASRPEGDIRQRLISLPNIEITANNNSTDIGRFVGEQMETYSSWTPILDGNASLKEDVMRTLVDKSQGMFQYAHLQIGQLMPLDNAQDIRDRLEKLPIGLTATYDEIYQRILDRPRYSRDLTLRAIKWVVSTTVPIPRRALPTFIQIDADAEKMDDGEKVLGDVLLGWCANLLTIDAPHEETRNGDSDYGNGVVWRPSHFSVVEYFKSIWPMPDVHCFVAKAYLVYFLSITPSTLGEDDQAVAEYAWKYWRASVRAQDHPGCSSELSKLLKLFLGAPDQGSARYRECIDSFDALIGIFNVEHRPSAPAHDMAYDSFYYLLQDWWESTEDDAWKFKALHNGHCVLTIAASAGCEPICDSLIRQGALLNPDNEADEWGNPLVAAVSQGHSHLVSFLLERGADVNQILSHGSFPNAFHAVDLYQDSAISLLDILLQHGADVNQDPRRWDWGSILIASVNSGKPEIVKFLIDNGAQVNAQVRHESFGSALVAGAYSGRKGIVALLLENGADVNQLCEFGEHGTALVAACSCSDLGMIKLLIENGADINPRLRSGKHGSPLAATTNFETAKYLVKIGADVHQPLLTGKFGSVLATHAARANTACLGLLIDHGAEVNFQPGFGAYGSALVAAAVGGGRLKLEFLLERGADINLQVLTGAYGSALAAAAGCEGLDTPLLKRFISRGANVNMVLEGGYFGTALISAAHSRRREHVEVLIESGADVNLRVETGQFRTALAAAKAESLVMNHDAAQLAWLRRDSGASVIDLLLHSGAKE